MPRATADVDAHDGAAIVGNPGAPDDEDNVGRLRVDFSGDAARGERLDESVLDDAPQLERRGFEIVGRPERDGEPQRR